MNKEELIELAKDFAKSVEELTFEEANELLKKKSNEKILQERIDKAIEYIEELADNENSYGDYEIHYQVKKDLLNILKGNDSNGRSNV